MSKCAEISSDRRYRWVNAGTLHGPLHDHLRLLLQLYSDALDIKMEIEDALLSNDSSDPIRGVFIRAPAILTAGEGVEVIASLEAKPHVSATAEVLKVVASSDGKIEMTADGKVRVIVAVQQGNILATAFHPELTPDLRWHQYVRRQDTIH